MFIANCLHCLAYARWSEEMMDALLSSETSEYITTVRCKNPNADRRLVAFHVLELFAPVSVCLLDYQFKKSPVCASSL